MPLTRAVAEASALGGGVATLYAAAGLATVVDGTNADLNDPLLRALDHFGIAAADPAAVVDADLGRVAAAEQVRFRDYLRLVAVEAAVAGLLSKPQAQQWEDYRVTYADMAGRAATLLESFAAAYRRRYLRSGAPAVGVMCPRSTNPLATAPYFPPFPGLPTPTDWPPDPLA